MSKFITAESQTALINYMKAIISDMLEEDQYDDRSTNSEMTNFIDDLEKINSDQIDQHGDEASLYRDVARLAAALHDFLGLVEFDNFTQDALEKFISILAANATLEDSTSAPLFRLIFNEFLQTHDPRSDNYSKLSNTHEAFSASTFKGIPCIEEILKNLQQATRTTILDAIEYDEFNVLKAIFADPTASKFLQGDDYEMEVRDEYREKITVRELLKRFAVTDPYPEVSIIASTEQELAQLRRSTTLLNHVYVQFESRVVPNHLLKAYIVFAEQRGIKTFIVGSATAALPNACAAFAQKPVICVPIPPINPLSLIRPSDVWRNMSELKSGVQLVGLNKFQEAARAVISIIALVDKNVELAFRKLLQQEASEQDMRKRVRTDSDSEPQRSNKRGKTFTASYDGKSAAAATHNLSPYAARRAYWGLSESDEDEVNSHYAQNGEVSSVYSSSTESQAVLPQIGNHSLPPSPVLGNHSLLASPVPANHSLFASPVPAISPVLGNHSLLASPVSAGSEFGLAGLTPEPRSRTKVVDVNLDDDNESSSVSSSSSRPRPGRS